MQVFRKSALAAAISTALISFQAAQATIVVETGETSEHPFRLQGDRSLIVRGTVQSHPIYSWMSPWRSAISLSGQELNSIIVIEETGSVLGGYHEPQDRNYASAAVFVSDTQGTVNIYNEGTINIENSFPKARSGVEINSVYGDVELAGLIHNAETGAIYGTHNGITLESSFSDPYSMRFSGDIINDGRIQSQYGVINLSGRSETEEREENRLEFTGLIVNNGILSGGNGIDTYHADINGSIENNGTITSESYSGIDIYRTNLSGSITNYGNIDAISGINVSFSDISGDIVNAQNITTSSEYFSGIRISSSTSRGSIINDGNLEGASGISISSSSINSVTNNGTINTEKRGIDVSSFSEENRTAESVINNGSVTVSGYQTSAIQLYQDLSGSLINNGTLSTTAEPVDLFEINGIDPDISNYEKISKIPFIIPFLPHTHPIDYFDLYQKPGTNLYAVQNLEQPNDSGTGYIILHSENTPDNYLNFVDIPLGQEIFPTYYIHQFNNGEIATGGVRNTDGFFQRFPKSSTVSIVSTIDGGFINNGSIETVSGSAIDLHSGSAVNISNYGNIQGPIAINALFSDALVLSQNDGAIIGDIYGSAENQDQLTLSGGLVDGNLYNIEDIIIAGEVLWTGLTAQNQSSHEGYYFSPVFFPEAVLNASPVFAESEHTFTVQTDGILNLPSPVSIEGNYVQQGTVNITPTNPNEAYIQISGTATIEEGAVIHLTPSNYRENTWNVLSAQQGLSTTDNILDLTTNSLLFNLEQIVDENTLQARITYNDLSEAVSLEMNDDNLAAFATSFQSALSTASDSTQTAILGQLNQVPSAEEFAALVSSELPGLDNETQTALLAAANAVQDGAFSNILSHLSDLRNSGSGIGTGDLPYSGGVWVKALHTEADQGEQRDGGTIYNGYKARSKGFTLGGDIELSPEWTVGTAFSFADVTVNVKDSGNNTTMDSYQLSLYGDWQRNNWFANGILNLGYNNVDSKRYAGSTRYEADYGSKQFGVNVTGGYQFWFNDKDTLIEPQLALNYSLLDTNSYKETSQSGDVVEVSPHNQEVIELGAGVRLSQLIETDRGPLLPEARLFAFHDFKADKVTQNVTAEAFNLPLSFRTVGIEPEKTRYQAGLGVSYWMDNNFSLSLNYDHTWQSDFKADSVQAKVRYDF